MSNPKLSGSIGYDAGHVHAFLETGDGEVARLHSEEVNWQKFDDTLKAKQEAALICRNLAVSVLRQLADQFDHGKIFPEL